MWFVASGKMAIELVRPTLRKKREGWGTRAFEVVQLNFSSFRRGAAAAVVGERG
jgi:hypothetical protein